MSDVVEVRLDVVEVQRLRRQLERAERINDWWEKQYPKVVPPFEVTATPLDGDTGVDSAVRLADELMGKIYTYVERTMLDGYCRQQAFGRATTQAEAIERTQAYHATAHAIFGMQRVVERLKEAAWTMQARVEALRSAHLPSAY